MTPPAHEQLRALVRVRDELLNMRPLVDMHKVFAAVREDVQRVEVAYRTEHGLNSYDHVHPYMDYRALETHMGAMTTSTVKLAGQIELHIHRLERECLAQLDATHPDPSEPEYHEQAQQILDAACPNERAGIGRIGDQGSQIIRDGWEPCESEVIASAAENHARGRADEDSDDERDQASEQ